MGLVTGIHHMTAICGDAQQNVDFYTGTLGLRLVKITVNFDDPSAYHLYYGDAAATPGTLLTFFPYPTGSGSLGSGQIVVTSLSVRPESVGYWRDRLEEIAVPSEDEYVVEFSDPDGILYRIVGDPTYKLAAPWAKSPVPVEHQIGGMHSVTGQVNRLEQSAAMVMRGLGFDHDEDDERDHYIFRLGSGGQGEIVELTTDGFHGGRPGKGTVHHVAFRVATDEDQLKMQADLRELGANITEVRDRDYFHSIYFRDPSGILFEIATDGPGFAIDETEETMGTSLQLPAMHEPRRAEIEAALPPLRLPG
jgi:glyoxalase family protein